MDRGRECGHQERITGWACAACLQTTWVRANGVQEQALWVQMTARRAREQARVTRETARRLRSPEASLPPLRYVLLPGRSPAAAQPPYRAAGVPPWEPFLPAAVPVRRRAGERPVSPHAATTLYLWGYAPPESAALHERGESTAAAGRFAAESGWEERRPGAWAKEITLPLPLSRAIQTMEALLRRETALAGWGMRYEA